MELTDLKPEMIDSVISALQSRSNSDFNWDEVRDFRNVLIDSNALHRSLEHFLAALLAARESELADVVAHCIVFGLVVGFKSAVLLQDNKTLKDMGITL